MGLIIEHARSGTFVLVRTFLHLQGISEQRQWLAPRHDVLSLCQAQLVQQQQRAIGELVLPPQMCADPSGKRSANPAWSDRPINSIQFYL